MRDIRFRAWWVSEKKMLHNVHLFYDTLGEKEHGNDYEPEQSFGALLEGYNAEDYQVMQFTGLLDSEGVDIYEFDILACPNWWWGNGFVYWNQGECGPCKGDSVGSYILAHDIEDPKRAATHNIWYGAEVTVIGNKFESPELLEEA